jgi:hypothetical protein
MELKVRNGKAWICGHYSSYSKSSNIYGIPLLSLYTLPSLPASPNCLKQGYRHEIRIHVLRLTKGRQDSHTQTLA